MLFFLVSTFPGSRVRRGGGSNAPPPQAGGGKSGHPAGRGLKEHIELDIFESVITQENYVHIHFCVKLS